MESKENLVKHETQEYLNESKKWELVDNIVDGNAKEYLRDVASLESDANKGRIRQEEYNKGAYLLNFTMTTLAKMIGGVFRNEPTTDIDGQVAYLLSNADGSNNDIHQLAQCALRGVLKHGRCGVFVDAPPKKEGDNAGDDAKGIKDPRMTIYPANSIINWSTDTRQMIVLKEQYTYSNPDNEFCDYEANQYRVLDIDEGIYRQRLYKFDESGDFSEMLEANPKAAGEYWSEIPFSFIGSSDNTPTIDPAPIFPIADLNRVVYRNTADNEELLFVMGQVMLVLAPEKTMTKEKWDKFNPNGVHFGARSGLLNPGGRAELLQASSNSALSQAIKDKLEQAIAIGAEIITPTSVITAESARLQKAGEVSTITNCANNISSAFEMAIGWCQKYKGDSSKEYEYSLNTDFFMTMLTAQDRAAWLNDIAEGVVTKDAYRDRLRASGEIDADVTNAELQRDAEKTIV